MARTRLDPRTLVRNAAVDVFMKAMSRSHKAVLDLSGGRVLRRAFGMQAVELRTTGRRTGKRRVTMLTAPVNEQRRIVLVASKGGDDRDPDWYRNLVAEPDVELVVDGVTRAMRARTATPAEHAELWPRVVTVYAGYAGYQRRTGRDIPLIICEPRND